MTDPSHLVWRTVAPFVVACLALLAMGIVEPVVAAEPPAHQATGVKVGEVTADSAIVWVRRTAKPVREATPPGFIMPKSIADEKIDSLPGACPGAAGRARVIHATCEDLSDGQWSPWATVDPASDFTCQFRLTGLRPATTYYYATETSSPTGAELDGAVRGRFATAPLPDAEAAVRFTVITGQAYRDLDDPDGFLIYDAMAAQKPDFIVPTGDTVYYDSDPPIAVSEALARYHWQRMYSLPKIVRFHREVPGYWEKDDHDTLFDDCWPGFRPNGTMTFAKGQAIFLEQTPMGAKTFRTFRWGRGLQVWVVEGRDFRSPNKKPDGPDKTIWGAEQKKWFFDSVLASDADWRVLISPTPVVGPDRRGKGDNHANAAFAAEGDEIRRWIAAHVPDNFFICCGDRHWQYHSVDPKTSVHEFSCGPASDKHAGGSPGENPEYHRFHRMKGGFLSVSVAFEQGRSTIAFDLCDVSGKSMYRFEQRQAASGAAR